MKKCSQYGDVIGTVKCQHGACPCYGKKKAGMRPVLFFSQSRDELGEADLDHGTEKWRKRSRREEKFRILWSVVKRKIIVQ